MVENSQVYEPGRCILFAAGHFTPMRVLSSNCSLISLNHRCHEHIQIDPSQCDFTQFAAVMKVVPGTSTGSCGRDFFGAVVHCLSSRPCSDRAYFLLLPCVYTIKMLCFRCQTLLRASIAEVSSQMDITDPADEGQPSCLIDSMVWLCRRGL